VFFCEKDKEVTPINSQPSSCHTQPATPSPLLALIAASIVQSFDRSWLSRPVARLAEDLGERPERVSRLKTRLLSPFQALVDRCLRRGRPPRLAPCDTQARVTALEALLSVAAQVIGELPIRARAIQDRLVAASDRLANDHGISRSRFARALGIPHRTLRYWAARSRKPSPKKEDSGAATEPGDNNKRKPSPPKSGRSFSVETTLPGLQEIGDTTNWNLFGVPLKVVAFQDPGNRGRRLWDGFAVDDKENHDVIAGVLEAVVGDKPGVQVLTDQGTPYLAQATTDALDAMEVLHAPQKEGDPTGKATVERSFRTVKGALEPIAAWTKTLAKRLPALQRADFAKMVGQVLISVFLRGYRTGASSRIACRSGTDDPVALEAIAHEQRERARAEDRSVKLTLQRIHDAYDFPGSRDKFVRAHRIYPVEDILEAERAMGINACRCHAKACDRYFAAVLRRVSDKNRARRRAQRRERTERSERSRHQRQRQARRQAHQQDPEAWIADALRLVEAHYRPAHGHLAFQGKGAGRGELVAALRHLAETSPSTAIDRAQVGWQRWLASGADRTQGCERVVRKLYDLEVERVLGAENAGIARSTSDALAAMMQRGASDTRPRPSTGRSLAQLGGKIC